MIELFSNFIESPTEIANEAIGWAFRIFKNLSVLAKTVYPQFAKTDYRLKNKKGTYDGLIKKDLKRSLIGLI